MPKLEPDREGVDPETGEHRYDYDPMSAMRNEWEPVPKPPPPQEGDPGPTLPPGQGKETGRQRRKRPYGGFISIVDFMAQMKPPDYLVDGLFLRGMTYTLTGNSGAGKTLFAILLAIKIALGQWCCGRKCQQGHVAFIAAENPENVRTQFFAMCAHLKVDAANLPISFHDGSFDIAENREKVRSDLAAIPNLAAVVSDSWQALYSADDDNDNLAALDQAITFRETTEGHPNRPVNFILAHPVKRASRDNLLPRGGSAALNELDGNAGIWLDEGTGIVTVERAGKWRGVAFAPLKLIIETIKPEELVDAQGEQMSCKVIRQLGPQEEGELREAVDKVLIAVLRAIAADRAISQRGLATAAGISRYKAGEAVEELKELKWIRPYLEYLTVTPEGKKALEIADEYA
jgi:hypothetical protein